MTQKQNWSSPYDLRAKLRITVILTIIGTDFLKLREVLCDMKSAYKTTKILMQITALTSINAVLSKAVSFNLEL